MLYLQYFNNKSYKLVKIEAINYKFFRTCLDFVVLDCYFSPIEYWIGWKDYIYIYKQTKQIEFLMFQTNQTN